MAYSNRPGNNSYPCSLAYFAFPVLPFSSFAQTEKTSMQDAILISSPSLLPLQEQKRYWISWIWPEAGFGFFCLFPPTLERTRRVENAC